MDKNIVYVGRFEFPDYNAAALRVRLVSKLFKKQGFNCKYITTVKLNKDVANTVDGDVIYSASLDSNVSYKSKNYINILRTIDNVKIIVAYNLPSIILYSLYRYSRFNKIRIIADVTDWYVATGYSSIIKRILKNIDTNLRMRILHKKMDGLIVISNYLKKYYNINNQIVLPPMTDMIFTNNSINNDKSKLMSFIYAGNPGVKANKDRLDYIIRAFEKLENIYLFEFHIYGITQRELIDIYPDTKKYLNYTSQILFHGKVEHKCVVEAVKNADYFIFTREDKRITKAGFPTKFTESISLGTPVITNYTSDISHYLVDGVNGYVIDCLSTDSIIRTLECVLKNDFRIHLDETQIRTFYFENYESGFISFIKKIDYGDS